LQPYLQAAIGGMNSVNQNLAMRVFPSIRRVVFRSIQRISIL
jgi:hypothetical protein